MITTPVPKAISAREAADGEGAELDDPVGPSLDGEDEGVASPETGGDETSSDGEGAFDDLGDWLGALSSEGLGASEDDLLDGEEADDAEDFGEPAGLEAAEMSGISIAFEI